jgi:hypothetical protein
MGVFHNGFLLRKENRKKLFREINYKPGKARMSIKMQLHSGIEPRPLKSHSGGIFVREEK